MSRFAEFLIVGGATLFLFPIAWLLRKVLGLDSSHYAFGFLTFYAAYVVNDPHFSVTYLLFYKDVRERIRKPRWIVCGIVVPLVLVVWMFGSLGRHSAQMLGWMIQSMYLLVGWHYVKQGFGVFAVLSARRGVIPTSLERWTILVHCFAGWAFAWANPALPAGEFEEKGVIYWAPARPRWLEIACGIALAASTIAVVAVLARKWIRERAMLPIVPLSGLLITVWSWTIFSSLDPLVQYVIPLLHAVQYFYFVWLMKRNEASAEEGPPAFGRPVRVRLAILAASALGLGWLLFRGIPTFLDDALVRRSALGEDLGETPFFAAFFVAVNIHHYFMDHVIWRRDNPDTRWLRSDPLPSRVLEA